MNKTALKSKKILIPAAVVAVLLAAGGAAVATDAFENDSRDQLSGSVLQQASDAALAEVDSPGAKVTDSELDDDADDAGLYEIEVTTDAGQEIDVHLDKSFAVVRTDTEDADDSDDSEASTDPASEQSDGRMLGEVRVDDSERPASDAEVTAVAAAAVAAVPGTVVEVESEVAEKGDTGLEAATAWKVEVIATDGKDWDVKLAADLTVLDKALD